MSGLPNSIRRIGLTGGIACGKSTLCQMLEARGWYIIDTDNITHQLMMVGAPAYHPILAEFGDSIVAKDGTIDRKKLGRIVYADPKALARLGAITHPIIRKTWLALRNNHESNHPDTPCLVVIPLLFESRSESLFNEIWCVAASRETQIARLMTSRGFTMDEALRRVDCQMPTEQKLARADKVLWSDLSMKKQLDCLLANRT